MSQRDAQPSGGARPTLPPGEIVEPSNETNPSMPGQMPHPPHKLGEHIPHRVASCSPRMVRSELQACNDEIYPGPFGRAESPMSCLGTDAQPDERSSQTVPQTTSSRPQRSALPRTPNHPNGGRSLSFLGASLSAKHAHSGAEGKGFFESARLDLVASRPWFGKYVRSARPGSAGG